MVVSLSIEIKTLCEREYCVVWKWTNLNRKADNNTFCSILLMEHPHHRHKHNTQSIQPKRLFSVFIQRYTLWRQNIYVPSLSMYTQQIDKIACMGEMTAVFDSVCWDIVVCRSNVVVALQINKKEWDFREIMTNVIV